MSVELSFNIAQPLRLHSTPWGHCFWVKIDENFFAHRQIGIEALSAQTDRPSTTHANGENFHMTLSAKVNADYNLVQLQTEFAQLCSTLNVSGTLNFIKNSA